ncbi:MAG: hypothetical protein AAF845_05685 [Bacteroidota bacterium]
MALGPQFTYADGGRTRRAARFVAGRRIREAGGNSAPPTGAFDLTFDTLADLLDPTTGVQPSDVGRSIWLRGYATPGDGGEGEFQATTRTVPLDEDAGLVFIPGSALSAVRQDVATGFNNTYDEGDEQVPLGTNADGSAERVSVMSVEYRFDATTTTRDDAAMQAGDIPLTFVIPWYDCHGHRWYRPSFQRQLLSPSGLIRDERFGEFRTRLSRPWGQGYTATRTVSYQVSTSALRVERVDVYDASGDVRGDLRFLRLEWFGGLRNTHAPGISPDGNVQPALAFAQYAQRLARLALVARGITNETNARGEAVTRVACRLSEAAPGSHGILEREAYFPNAIDSAGIQRDAGESLWTYEVTGGAVYDYVGPLRMYDGCPVEGSGGAEFYSFVDDRGVVRRASQPRAAGYTRLRLMDNRAQQWFYHELDGTEDPELLAFYEAPNSFTLATSGRTCFQGVNGESGENVLREMWMDGNQWNNREELITSFGGTAKGDAVTDTVRDEYWRNTPAVTAYANNGQNGASIQQGFLVELENMGITGYCATGLLAADGANSWSEYRQLGAFVIGDSIWNHPFYKPPGIWEHITLVGNDWGSPMAGGEVQEFVIGPLLEDHPQDGSRVAGLITENPVPYKDVSPPMGMRSTGHYWPEQDLSSPANGSWPDGQGGTTYNPHLVGQTFRITYANLFVNRRTGAGQPVTVERMYTQSLLQGLASNLVTGGLQSEPATIVGLDATFYSSFVVGNNPSNLTRNVTMEHLHFQDCAVGNGVHPTIADSTIIRGITMGSGASAERIKVFDQRRTDPRQASPHLCLIEDVDWGSVTFGVNLEMRNGAGPCQVARFSGGRFTSSSQTVISSNTGSGRMTAQEAVDAKAGDFRQRAEFVDGFDITFNANSGDFDRFEPQFAMMYFDGAVSTSAGTASEDSGTVTASGGESGTLDIPTSLIWRPQEDPADYGYDGRTHTQIAGTGAAKVLGWTWVVSGGDATDFRSPTLRLTLSSALTAGETIEWSSAVRPPNPATYADNS